jgi:predicted TIM-barrel fold metal-dependent hydrolase
MAAGRASGAIHRDFLPGDMRPLLDAAGIDGTVLVQTMESEADTAFLLDLADKPRPSSSAWSAGPI